MSQSQPNSSQASVPSVTGVTPNTNRIDPGWKYVTPVRPGDTNETVCKYCTKTMKGGITRAKQHLAGKKGNVASCKFCPAEVKLEMLELLSGKRKSRDDIDMAAIRDMDLGGIQYDESEDDLDGDPTPSVARTKKGPMDAFCKKPPINKKNKAGLRQASIKETFDKQTTEDLFESVGDLFYQASIPFNVAKMKPFKEMLRRYGAYGPNPPVPSYHQLRVPILKKAVDKTKSMLQRHKEQWRKHGCSIMSDSWTDRKGRSIINFLVNSSAGTVFVKSVDGSDFVKTGEKLFELLDALVEEIGEENVVQMISDNGSNYVLAGKLLEEKRKHLFWTPCAAHCVDLMLEDIGKIPVVNRTIRRGITIVGFIYNHCSTLSMLRHHTNKRELVRHGKTRFATSFLSLERLYQEKNNVRTMFISDEWNTNKLSTEDKGKEVTKYVYMVSFWRNVLFTLKVMAPLVRVLRLVDSERKPAMGYIYEAMEKAKETIMKSFLNDEAKYKDVFKIIDKRWSSQLHRPLHAAGHLLNPDLFFNNPKIEFDLKVNNGLYNCIRKLVPCPEVQQKILNEIPIYKSGAGLFGDDFAKSQRSTLAPAQWWRMYGHETPNLQQLAIKIMSLTCSASGCERNWSVFEQVHTKKRNRLGYQKMHELVFVKYNQQLFDRFNIRDEIDPISLDDIDECNEWMVGEMDDENEGDLVFENDPNLDWQTVYEASGFGEAAKKTRQQTRKRKTMVAKNTRGNTNTGQQKRRKKTKVVQEEDEEDEVEMLVSEEEEGEVGAPREEPTTITKQQTRKRKTTVATNTNTNTSTRQQKKKRVSMVVQEEDEEIEEDEVEELVSEEEEREIGAPLVYTRKHKLAQASKGKENVVQEEEEEEEEEEDEEEDWLKLPPHIQNELLNFVESEEEEEEGDAPLVNDLENDYVGVGEED